MIAECVAYTFEQSKLNCFLHSSTQKGKKYIRGKQTGSKKPNFILSLPEVSYCLEENRQRRCRREPKCDHVDCLRNALVNSANHDNQVPLGFSGCMLCSHEW